eukprot:COSAG02_NODE_3303_length_6979_cov_14.734884_3_plen_74_part_00
MHTLGTNLLGAVIAERREVSKPKARIITNLQTNSRQNDDCGNQIWRSTVVLVDRISHLFVAHAPSAASAVGFT